MSIHHCTFWYPTIYHTDLEYLSHDLPCTIENEDISDNSTAQCYISITLDREENLNIKLEVEDLDFVLKHQDKRRNGFALYTFDSEEFPESIRNNIEKLKKILSEDIYHIAKEFYHKHEAGHEKNSALVAFISEKSVEIDKDDNIILIHFLENYASVFETYAKRISIINQTIQNIDAFIDKIGILSPNRMSDSEKKEIKKEYQEKILSNLLDASKLCENALIEYTYYKTLLNSKYNKSFHHTTVVDPSDEYYEQKNQWRMRALNIRNSIRYIESIKYKNQNRLNKLSQHLLEKVDLNTIAINKVLEDSKKNDKIYATVSWFSVFLAFMFGVPIFFKMETIDKIWGGLTILGIFIFAFLIYKQRKRKV